MKAFVFPGQGAQYQGMAIPLLERGSAAKTWFEQANDILGFDILQVMIDGSDEDLRQTRITQPAIFLHSVITALISDQFDPAAVAGHSLGELSALVATGAMSFEDGLRLVHTRALAMQEACEITPGTMAAIVGMDNEQVERVCEETQGIVVPANYNCPGQLVISGELEAVEAAMATLVGMGCRNAIKLSVGGAFHSPLMAYAEEKLKEGISNTMIQSPCCPIYQNIDAAPHVDSGEIRINLVRQLTGAVKWSQSVVNMLQDGITEFVEVGGNGKVLSGLIKKVDRKIPVSSL
ncbi:MAG: ACP S-malonyltransferase [Saprospiraceae bacterium]|nr:ACP S-malonyltransferase [Saprospiraceae bacterium]